jgi:hypothetical protein
MALTSDVNKRVREITIQNFLLDPYDVRVPNIVMLATARLLRRRLQEHRPATPLVR